MQNDVASSKIVRHGYHSIENYLFPGTIEKNGYSAFINKGHLLKFLEEF